MDIRALSEAIAFNPEKMAKNVLFDSPHMFFDCYCLLPGQAQKVHAHAESDKVYLVMEGTGSFTIGEETRDLGPGHAVIARAGEPHGVANATEEPLVVVVTMAPRPA